MALLFVSVEFVKKQLEQKNLKKYMGKCQNGHSTVRVYEIDSVQMLEKWKKVRKMHKNSLKTC